MKRRRHLSFAMVGASVFAAAAALADPSTAELAAGRKLFSEAVELENAGHWSDAAQKLRAALAVKETPGLRFHLARCEEEQGNLVEALREYDRAQELIRAGAEAADVVPLLDSARASVEQRVPRLRLIMPADAPPSQIEIDQKPAAPAVASEPQAVNPGRHRIVVRVPGRKAFERDIVLEPGSRADVSVELEEEKPAAPNRPESSPMRAPALSADRAERVSSTSARTLVLASEAGFTVVSLGVGVAFAFMHSSASDRVIAAQAAVDRSSNGDLSACAGPMPVAPESCSELASAVSDRDQSGALMFIGFVGAGAGALATAATWLLWRDADAKSRAWRVDATLAQRGAVFSVGGAF